MSIHLLTTVLLSLRHSWPLPAQVRDVICVLGCAGRRRGCRAGRRARDRRSTDININTAPQSADRSVHHIPTVSSRRPSPLLVGRRRGLLYHGYRERRATVRRPLQPVSQLRVSSTSGATAVGLLYARSADDEPAPSLYVLNAAALSKPHAIEQLTADLISYAVDVAVITETYLKVL